MLLDVFSRYFCSHLSIQLSSAKGISFYADFCSCGFYISLLYVKHGLLLLENEICTAETVCNKTFPASYQIKNGDGKKATLSFKPSRANCDPGYS